MAAPRITRIRTTGGRFYRVSGMKDLLPSVTTILDVINKPQLLAWSKTQALSSIRAQLQAGPPITSTPSTLEPGGGEGVEDRSWIENIIKEAGASADKIGSEAAGFGTGVHTLIEKLLKAERGVRRDMMHELVDAADLVEVPPVYETVVASFMKWRRDIPDLVITDVEKMVYSAKFQYAGALDAVAIIPATSTAMSTEPSASSAFDFSSIGMDPYSVVASSVSASQGSGTDSDVGKFIEEESQPLPTFTHAPAIVPEVTTSTTIDQATAAPTKRGSRTTKRKSGTEDSSANEKNEQKDSKQPAALKNNENKNGEPGIAASSSQPTKRSKVIALDWKTSNNIYPEYALQLAAYAKALEEMTGTIVEEGWIVKLDKHKVGWQVRKVRNLDESFQVFLCALHMWRRLKLSLFDKTVASRAE